MKMKELLRNKRGVAPLLLAFVASPALFLTGLAIVSGVLIYISLFIKAIDFAVPLGVAVVALGIYAPQIMGKSTPATIMSFVIVALGIFLAGGTFGSLYIGGA